MKDTCITVEEQVIIPNVPTVTVEEQVIIPAIVQEPNEVEQAIDPAWREYVYNVEDKFVNAIITEYPNMPTILAIGYSNSNSELRPAYKDNEFIKGHWCTRVNRRRYEDSHG